MVSSFSGGHVSIVRLHDCFQGFFKYPEIDFMTVFRVSSSVFLFVISLQTGARRTVDCFLSGIWDHFPFALISYHERFLFYLLKPYYGLFVAKRGVCNACCRPRLKTSSLSLIRLCLGRSQHRRINARSRFSPSLPSRELVAFCQSHQRSYRRRYWSFFAQMRTRETEF